MEIVGIGVDLVEVERVHRMIGRHRTFLERVFAPEEIAYCQSQASPAECFAARWAAREEAAAGFRPPRPSGWEPCPLEMPDGLPVR